MSMKHISLKEILQMEREYRRTFINCLWGLKSVHLVGTVNQNNVPNLSIISSVFHLGANPPMMGICFRPPVANTHTFDNILSTKQFTVNVITEQFYKKAHRCSANFRDGISEFDEVGLSPKFEAQLLAPFVVESPIRFSVVYHEHFSVSENESRIVVGKVQDVFIDETLIDTKGYISYEKVDSVVVSGLEGYHSVKEIDRLGYERVSE